MLAARRNCCADRFVIDKLMPAIKDVGEGKSISVTRTRRDQRAFCFAQRAIGRPSPPLAHARSATQHAPSSRAAFAMCRMSGPASVCGSALHSGSVPAVTPPALHFFRPQTADRSEDGFICFQNHFNGKHSPTEGLDCICPTRWDNILPGSSYFREICDCSTKRVFSVLCEACGFAARVGAAR